MHARLAEHITPYSGKFNELPDLTTTAGLVAINNRVTQQATLMAYNNVFKVMFILSMLSLPFVFFFRKAKSKRTEVAAPE